MEKRAPTITSPILTLFIIAVLRVGAGFSSYAWAVRALSSLRMRLTPSAKALR